MAIRKYSKEQLKSFRKDIALLKSKGLVSKKVDARSVKPTSHMVKTRKEFSDVLSGKASVVKTPKRKTASEYKDMGFRSKFGNVVIPKEKGEQIRYDKKTEQIVAYRKRDGKRVKKIYKRTDAELPTGKQFRYTMPFKRGSGTERYTFPNMDELKRFMSGYDFKGWQKYLEVEEVLPGDPDYGSSETFVDEDGDE